MKRIINYLNVDKKYLYYGCSLFFGLRMVNSLYSQAYISNNNQERELNLNSNTNFDHEVLIDNEGATTFNTFLLDEVILDPHKSSELIRLLRVDNSPNEKNIYIIYGTIRNFGNTWRFESSYIEKYNNEIKTIQDIKIQSVLLNSNANFKWDKTNYILIEKQLNSIYNYNYKKDSLIDNSDNKLRFSRGLHLKRNDIIPLLK